MTDTLTVDAGGALRAEFHLPGDKSISHRAVMLGAIAAGTTTVAHCLMGDDVRATIGAFRALGVHIDASESGDLSVHGSGPHGLKPALGALDMGNSGTAMRLMCGLLAGCGVPATLTGDASLSRRPMRRVTIPLAAMGAKIETQDDGTPPIEISGGDLHGIDYELPVASAQVKSAVLLAGMRARGTTRVIEPAPTRDHTERMLQSFGIDIQSNGSTIAIKGGQTPQATYIQVPGDISSAAFFMVGAAVVPGSEIKLQNVGVNPTRVGVIEILRRMGADIKVTNERLFGNEPVADITVRGGTLRGIEIPAAAIPSAIDEFPAIFVAAASAHGKTRLRGAAELKVKESDRIEVMATGLRKLGVEVATFDDGIEIVGGSYGGGQVDSGDDHRVAMAFAVSALRASHAISIRGCAPIATSFPSFLKLARDAGLRIRP
jgi:3-phosphoshikimate 1-carboxyvinyltransferase